jgi:N-acetylmuramoyl-L-alanine amidase
LFPPRFRFLIACAVLVACAAAAAARQPSSARPALPYAVISQEGRRPLAASLLGDQVMVDLDDLATLFQLSIREDTLAGGVTVGSKGKTVILMPGQALASAAGRLVSLPFPVTRDGRRWLVPIEFVNRALGLVYESRLEVRKNSRLIIVGDLRVPRIIVRQETLGVQARVTFDVTPRTAYAVTAEPNRLLVRFEADALDVALPPVTPQGLIQGLRIADPNSTIAIDVGPRYGSFRAALLTTEGAAAQVQLDIFPTAAEMPLPVQPRPAVPEAPAPGLPAAPEGLRTLVIDPGHGGDEVGAKGATGLQEKDVVLAVARYLKVGLEARLGVRVLMTRDGDQAVPLDDRAALANNNKADLFVSLHANASVRREVSGAQIYCLAGDQGTDDGRQAAGRHVLPTVGGGSRDIEVVPWELAQVRYLGESATLAGALEEQMRGRVRLSARAVQQAPLRVLAGANMPAVLVEVGFLTNPDEEQQLASDPYLRVLSQALLDGILRYRELAGRVRQGPAPAPGPEPPRPLAAGRKEGTAAKSASHAPAGTRGPGGAS